MAATLLRDPPTDCISRVRFGSEQGSSLLLVSSWDSHVRLYDVASGQLTGTHRQQLPVLDCAFNQDCSRFFAGGLDKHLITADFQSGQELRIGQHDEPIRCVEFHRETNQVFTGSWDRTLQTWDPRQPGAPTQRVDLGTKVFALGLGSTHIAVGGANCYVFIHDVRKIALPLEKRESSLKHQLRCLKMSNDQRFFASGSVEGRVAIEYIDASENEKSRYAFKCHRTKKDNGDETVHPVNALAFHPVHGTFASGGSDGGLYTWDAFKKKRLWRADPFDTAVSTLDFSSDGSMLALGVSYTWDDGEEGLQAQPANQLYVRPITQSEVMSKK